MKTHTITISNIHCNNHHYLNDCVGIAGMSGAFKPINECAAVAIITDELLSLCDIPWSDVQQMLGAFVCRGFTVKIESI